jgi:membrane protease YdiL (CAAX protease family)
MTKQRRRPGKSGADSDKAYGIPADGSAGRGAIGRPGGSRARAAAEIAFVILCILAAEWCVIPLFGRNKAIGMIPVIVALLFCLLSHAARGENAREIGFSGRNFVPASRLLLSWMIPATVVLAVIGGVLGTLQFNWPRSVSGFALSQFLLFLWGLLQQYVLQGVVNRRAQEIFGKGRISIAAAALIFSALHFPNLWLMLATLAGGYLWAAVYQRVPNLYAVALSHCIMTNVLAFSLSPALLHGLRVGYNYY